MSFDRVNVDNGLQNNIVYAVTSDKKGFHWFATATGIDRYDGTKIVSYPLPTKNGYEFSYSPVPYICIDHDQTIWIATLSNVYKYQRNKDKFIQVDSLENHLEKLKNITHFNISPTKQELLIGHSKGFLVYNIKTEKTISIDGFATAVKFITQDNDGIIWVGTNKGLRRFIINNNQINEITEPNAVLTTLNNATINYISFEEDYIWIATATAGINIIHKKTNQLTSPLSNMSNAAKYAVKDIYHQKNKTTWIAVDGGGIIELDTNKKIKSIIKNNEDNNNSLSNNAVYDIHFDGYNRMWIATYGGGVNISSTGFKPFQNYQHETDKENSLKNNAAKAIFQHSDSSIWFGTRKGISILKQNNTWQHLNEDITPNFTNDNVLAITGNRKDKIWIGTYGGGLMEYNTKTKALINYTTTSTPFTIGTDFVYALCFDTKQRLWIGGIRGHLSYIDYTTGAATIVPNPYAIINSIVENGNGEILIGTEKGIALVENNKIEPYIPLSIAQKVLCIEEAGSSNYWIGTQGSGLLLASKEKGVIKSFKTTNGLPSDVISGITKDSNDDLWLGTSLGIAHYIKKSNFFTTYTKADGLVGSQVNFGAIYKTIQNNLIFGTTEGFTMFSPAALKSFAISPTLIFTALTVNNKPISADDKTKILKQQIDEVAKIVLRHNENSISIEFVNTSPTYLGKHMYSWKLEGFDDVWTNPSDRTSANYTNLASGKYLLRVKTFVKGQEENTTERTLVIEVKSPWWATIWAYIAYFLLLIAAYLSVHNYLKVSRTRKLYAERLKLNIIISHEIRTPLSLVKGPVSALARSSSLQHDDIVNMQLAEKNIEKLENIINQFIEYQKAGFTKMQMQVSSLNIVKQLEDITTSFMPLLQEKNIKFTFTKSENNITLLYDKDKIEKVFNNILSNAIKYTPAEKAINITISKDAKDAIITVTDNGIGIPTKQLRFLFKGYFRADNTINLKETGSGIGLSVVKEMVDLHHGKLSFESTQNKGTTITIKLPLYSEWLKQFKVDEDEVAAVLQIPKPNYQNTSTTNDKKIVIAEDNDELRGYLQNQLQLIGYQVHTAVNGKEALEIIRKNGADLVITDIMMPEMNGFQLCTALKKDLNSCHIPLIMLTAISDKDYLMEGYRSGADDYVRKPFDLSYIQVRMENLLQNRTRFQQKIMHVFEQDEQLIKEDIDVIWLKKVTQIIADNISKSDFSVEKLASLMAMSRPVLFRKFKTIANESPQQYIINIRLRYAVEMLQKGDKNISEVAYMSGFENPKYFSTSFKKHFGKSPREYIQDVM